MFANPILGGSTLIRPAIQSPNYVAGVSGWSINADGTAEFNGVTIRGTLQSSNYVANTSGWQLNNAGTVFLNGTLTMGGSGHILTAAAAPNIDLASFAASNANRITFNSGVGSSAAGYLQGSGVGGVVDSMILQSPNFGGGIAFVELDSLTGSAGITFSQTISGTQIRHTIDTGGVTFNRNVKAGLSAEAFVGTWPGAAAGQYSCFCSATRSAVDTRHYGMLVSNVDANAFLSPALPGGTLFIRDGYNGTDIAQFVHDGTGISSSGVVNRQVSVPLTLTSTGDQMWFFANYMNTFLAAQSGRGFRFWDIGWGEIMNFNRNGAQADCRIPAFPSFATSNCGMSNISGQLCVNTSSARIKTAIVDLPPHDSGEANPVWNLKARRFHLNPAMAQHADEYNARNPDGYGIAGLIAEEVNDVMPHAAFRDGRAPEDGGMGGILTWDERAVIAYLVDAVQYLKGKVKA